MSKHYQNKIGDKVWICESTLEKFESVFACRKCDGKGIQCDCDDGLEVLTFKEFMRRYGEPTNQAQSKELVGEVVNRIRPCNANCVSKECDCCECFNCAGDCDTCNIYPVG